MTDYKNFIQTSLKDASKIATESFGAVSGTTKSDDNNQVLTETDIAVGNLIVSRIKEAFPGHNVIDEEAGVIDNKSQFTWVVDPIDGTSNFASGVPMYGIMVGLLDGAAPIGGGISLPSFDEVYIATKGQGATCNGTPIAVSKESDLLNCLVAYGIDGHQEDKTITEQEVTLLGDIVLGVRNVRSSNSVFDQALVAKGRYAASMNRTTKIWDNVAQQIVIEEAGGIYTDFFGKPIDYTDPLSKVDDNFTMCAAAPQIHARLQKIIHHRA